MDAWEETTEEGGTETRERTLISSLELTTTTVYTAAGCEEGLEEIAAEDLEAVVVEIFRESLELSLEFFVGKAADLPVDTVIPLVMAVVNL